MSSAVVPETTHEGDKLDCIHCGICLSVCPTYLQLGSEVDSPRGRIYMINAVEEGRIAPDSPTFEKHMSLCLECRACETACPSGVQFSIMMNDARAMIRDGKKHGALERFFRNLVFRWVLPGRVALHVSFRLLRFYQRSGIQSLIRGLRILKLFPRRVAEMESLLPSVPPSPRYSDMADTASGEHTVSLFDGCIMPELFGPVHEATVRVLQRNDIAVSKPRAQTCCGALHLHDGERELAKELARRNIDAFEKCGSESVIVNAAGCGAMLKEYGHLLKDDPEFADRAVRFSRSVRDVSEFLSTVELKGQMGSIDKTVAYDDPCHLLHGQGIKAAPRDLLGRIPGLRLVVLANADRCCGSAGIYNITHPEMSASILEEKLRDIVQADAELVASGNPGCLLQINMGLRSKKSRIRAVHPVELLDQAYQAGRASQSSK